MRLREESTEEIDRNEDRHRKREAREENREERYALDMNGYDRIEVWEEV